MVSGLSLSKKLLALGLLFLFASAAVMGAAAWAGWRLDRSLAVASGAAHLRADLMRLQLAAAAGNADAAAAFARQFSNRLAALDARAAHGTSPGTPVERSGVDFDRIGVAWQALQHAGADAFGIAAGAQFSRLVHEIDRAGQAAEQSVTRWSQRVRLLPGAMLLLALTAALAFFWLGHAWVVAPVKRLRRGFERVRSGEFATRVEVVANDELGRLAAEFNLMARTLQDSRSELERSVRVKTADIAERNQQLGALYAVSALAAEAPDLDTLARGFVEHIRRVAESDGVALRWADEDNENYVLLAADGLPASLVEHERHLPGGACACCTVRADSGLRVLPVTSAGARLPHCREAGFKSVVSVPLAWQQRVMGEVTLFYRGTVALPDARRGLLSVMGRHLASAMENLRVAALEREAMVTAERKLIARELHDSIAQSLAFLKIQAGLLRGAMDAGDLARRDQSLAELDTGINECLADVRELLVHFRVRTQDEDIEGALRATLSKFEHQANVRTRCDIRGHGVPLAPDVQIQVLHVVQEALSNVRKHAGAQQVELLVQRHPRWRFEVRDDGRGFDVDGRVAESVHVGLDIMRERAQRIDAALTVVSAPGAGTRVVLELPGFEVQPARAAAVAPAREAASATVST